MMDLDKKMIGKQFGWLTVIKRADSANGRKRYLCRCKCGKEVIKFGKYLRNGATTSCGCVRSKKFRGTNSRTYKDLTGQVFGKLTVINVKNFNNGRANFLCKCECGNMTIVSSGNLQCGKTKSCGCLKTIDKMLECTNKSLSVERGTSVFGLMRKNILKMLNSCNPQGYLIRMARKSSRGILYDLKIIISKQISRISTRALSSGVKEVSLLPRGLL